ncbi:MAG: exodeoxyribonuclease VII large subunit [Chloroflexi bacterium]|nr:MAG: exodeoxyribonuclease VII large subunit [Chloroflexota bacterium]
MTAEPQATTSPRVWRVSDLNRRVRGLLDADRALADVWVEGEVSGPSYPPSGHCFFTLKDAHSQIRAVLFREELARATVRPEHGAQLVCHGRVRAYEPQGVYQLYVESVTPVGAGDLHAQYEALRARLAEEGLFDEARKRALPRWPRRIGVVTSPVGAVWDDICTVLRRRYPMVELVLSPTAVQGGIAAPAIIRALKRLYAVRDLDLVILARGGGSIEDLWGFNDEQVVRTVLAAPVPVVVGVGHESDVTLADFAADRRAPTPSAAAEIAVPDGTQLPAILNRMGERAAVAMTARLVAATRAVRGEGRALTGLQPDLAGARQRAAELLDRSYRATTAGVERRTLAVAGLGDALRALGPVATLERGYAVARRSDGMIIRDPTEVAPGDDLEVVVARGAVRSRVTTVHPGEMEELLG